MKAYEISKDAPFHGRQQTLLKEWKHFTVTEPNRRRFTLMSADPKNQSRILREVRGSQPLFTFGNSGDLGNMAI
jgi:hypothetical protein